jgi:hypothetical protein
VLRLHVAHVAEHVALKHGGAREHALAPEVQTLKTTSLFSFLMLFFNAPKFGAGL